VPVLALPAVIFSSVLDANVLYPFLLRDIEPAMTNDPGDRHVLAAAVAADSELVVTLNLDDFPSEACEPVGVEARHPDDFLLDLLDLAPEAVRAVLEEQASDLTPPWPLEALLGALERAGVPRFASAIRTLSP
jgi:hypothetical protein